MRDFKPIDTVSGRIFFALLDSNGDKVATVLATPYKALIVYMDDKNTPRLTPEEQLYCQMETLKTVPR